jgi:hypothetical protein
MRHTDRLFKTMSAAKVCIAECLKAPSPRDSLAKYLDFLRSDPQWTASELAEVEAAAAKAITAASCRSAAAPSCHWPPTSQSASPTARS